MAVPEPDERGSDFETRESSSSHDETHTHTGKTRRQVRPKTRLKCRTSRGSELRGQENLEWNTGSHRDDGAQARDESGSTGPGRRRNTPRISRS